MAEMLKQVQHDTLNFSIILMKKQGLIILSLLLPLLFTSCLADLLNEKFNYQVPISIHYSTTKGKQPSARKLPSNTALTSADLPVLSEAGWIFDGWYLDKDFTQKVEEGSTLSKDATLFAKWTPRTDTPFTIYNYFLNVRTGTLNFVHWIDKDQRLTGITGEYVNPYDYDLTYNNSGDPELEKYHIMTYSQNDEDRIIKGDGSTVVSNYYYMNNIYDTEFSTLLQALPEDNQSFEFVFIQDSSASTFDIYSVAQTILGQQVIKGQYYDNYLGKDIYHCNRNLSLNFSRTYISEIPENTFRNIVAIDYVSLPYTCTVIKSGAFYGCKNLNNINVGTNDSSKNWYCNGENLGQYPDGAKLAGLLTNNQYNKAECY